MSNIPNREEIELRAYEIYIQRGCEDGHDLEDWAEAERQLTSSSELASVVEESSPAVAELHRAAAVGRQNR